MKRMIIYGLLACLCLGSCSDVLDVKPESRPTYLNYWNDEQEVAALVDGMHQAFRSNFGGFIVHYRDRGVQLDEPGTVWKDLQTNRLENKLDRYAPELSWFYEYNVIFQANFILDNLHRAPLTEERLNFYRVQAMGVRAYVYLYLVQTWGDVPFVTDSQDVGEKGRTPALEVLDFVIGELLKARELAVPANELRDWRGNPIKHRQYVSRGVVNALLMKAYGWKAGFYGQTEYWKEVVKYATEVIEDGSYELAADPEEMCVKTLKGDSPGGVWEMCFHNDLNEFKASGLYMAGILQKYPLQSNTTERTRRFYRVLNTTVDSMYEDKDLRKKAYVHNFWLMAAKAAGITQNSVYFIKWRYPVNWETGIMAGMIKTYDQNEVMIRLADVYLRRAEAYAYLGETEKAAEDLNVIRRRAGATLYTAAEGDLFEAIQKERDKELFLESFCIHYFDVMRNRTWKKYLKGDFKTLTEADVEAGALFLPISIDALEKNPKMEQTLYWKRKPKFNY